MNYRAILKVYKDERKLTDDETAFLNVIRRMNESEIALLIEGLSDKPQKKSSKKSVGKEREYDHCLRCGTTKRDSSHKDQSSPDYHEFQSSKNSDAASGGKSSTKSARASGMAAQLNRQLDGRRQEEVVIGDPDAGCSDCIYVFAHNVHHLPSAEGYHEFQPAEQAAATGGD